MTKKIKFSGSPSYLFYDIESSGLNKSFDQVIQFAAIRTDVDFNPLEEINLYARLSPDVIPSPSAVIIHRIPVSQLNDKPSELEVIQKIHQLLNTPGTISCGYNNLGFDDELLRFSFYRNLLPPYTHQYANACHRIDIYPMIAMYYLHKKDTLNWPTKDGKPCLKLEQLAQYNHIDSGIAHDALNDVKATLSLAKRLKQQKKIWYYTLLYFNKQTDQQRIQALPLSTTQNHWGILVNPRLGAHHNYQCPVLLLGQHQHYRNQTIWLRLDQADLEEIYQQDISSTKAIIRKKLGEPGFVLPPKTRFTDSLSSNSKELLEHNLNWLSTQTTVLQEITEHHCNKTYPATPHLDIDAALYEQPFPSPHDTKLCSHFHKQATVTEKIALIHQFQDPKLVARAIRMMGRFYLDQLPADWQKSFSDHMSHITNQETTSTYVNHYQQARLSPQTALSEIIELKQDSSLDTHQLSLLNDLQTYIEEKY